MIQLALATTGTAITPVRGTDAAADADRKWIYAYAVMSTCPPVHLSTVHSIVG